MTKVKIINASDLLPLRAKVLRPGMKAEEAVFKGDDYETTFHVGVVSDSGEIIGVSSFYLKSESAEKNPNEYKLRGMAVDPDLQTKGCGTMMLDFALSILKEKNAKLLWCNARVSASGFYVKKGFTTDFEEFHLEPAGAHYKMRLILD